MARSLMELYGGGMGGPTTNYQLGGRIASSRRGREYRSEMRTLQEQADEAARRQKKSGIWGGVGSFLGGTIGTLTGIPGGTAAGAAIGRGLGESGYKEVDVSGGKYGKQFREDVAEGQESYKKGALERALVSGATAAISPGMYESAGKAVTGAGEFIKGLPTAFEAGKEMGLTGMQAFGDYAKSFGPGAPFGSAVGSAASAADIVGGWGGDIGQASTVARPDLGLPGDLDYRQMREAYGEMYPSREVPYSNFLKMVESGLPGQGFYVGGGLIDYMVPKMQGGGSTSPHGYSPTLDPMGTQYGYGTARDPLGALKQMGMHGVAADPNLAQYMGDLPQFGMGYEQRLGDIKTGAQTGLFGLAQPTGPAATSFAGEGASGVAEQKARQGIMQQYGTRSRGVVEDYQADVLSAISDIEQKGQFEFQSPWEKTGETEEDWRRRTAAEQDLLTQQGTQLYSQQGLYGLQDPTQGQTGMPGQQQQQQQWGQTPWGQSQQQQNPWQQQQQQTTTGWPTGG